MTDQKTEKMACLEFQRLALIEPNNRQHNFVEHAKQCADCLAYVAEVRKMDADVAKSLHVNMPAELSSRLQLETEMQKSSRPRSGYALAASLAAVLLVAGLVFKFFIGPSPEQVAQDYQQLLTSVIEHMDEQPITPVWGAAQANVTVSTLLASYDPDLQLQQMQSLQFGQICPMGRYRGLHATLETENGQTTFAYIKGMPLGEVSDSSLNGYITRVKPVVGGNLVIISRTKKSLLEADQQLAKAMVWEI